MKRDGGHDILSEGKQMEKEKNRVKELVAIFLITIRRIMTEIFSRAKKVARQKKK